MGPLCCTFYQLVCTCVPPLDIHYKCSAKVAMKKVWMNFTALFCSSLNVHNQFLQVSWLALAWPRVLVRVRVERQ